jgi:uncharacterized membrane protein YdjX (TVP38/TMEM64 family)
MAAPEHVRPAGNPDRARRELRILVAGEGLLLAIALGAWWLASASASRTARLVAFFLYGLPCEFLVPIAPHDPAVLYVSRFHAPATVALIAGVGTLLAEAMNFELLQRLGELPVFVRASRAPLVRRCADAFGRAPFATLWVAGLVPIIPFSPLRLLVRLRQYPRGRFLMASVSSRTVRFYVVAVLGHLIVLPTELIVVLFLALLFAVTLPGVARIARESAGRA